MEPTMYKWCVTNVFDRVIKQLRIKFPQHTFTEIHSPDKSLELGIKHDVGGKKYGYHMLILENADNGKYILVNYYDWVNTLTHENYWDTENLTEVLTSIGTHSDDLYFKPTQFNYTPLSFTVQSVEAEYEISKIDTSFDKKVLSKKPTFRGLLYNFRKYLSLDRRFTVLSTANSKFLSKRDYVKEVNSFKLNLSLDGEGEIAHRDIECMGVGSAVLRRKLSNKFHNKLVPNHHYISVNTDDLNDLPSDIYFKELADRFYERYLEVRDDDQYLEFVGNNALQWYKENGTTDANVTLLLKLLDFEKLL